MRQKPHNSMPMNTHFSMVPLTPTTQKGVDEWRYISPVISSLLWLGGSICFLVDVAVDGAQWGLEMGGAVSFTAGSALMVLHALQTGGYVSWG